MAQPSPSAARVRRMLAAGGLALAMTGTAFSGVAGAESGTGEGGGAPPAVGHLLQCIAAQGVTPPGPGGITTGWIDQVVAAARACGVELPEALVAEARRQAAEAEAKRACLEGAGLAKPAGGQTPTPEQIVAFKAALVACGITPPEAEHRPAAKPAPKPEMKKKPTPRAKARHGKKTRARGAASRR